jgi:hypothetical protein
MPNAINSLLREAKIEIIRRGLTSISNETLTKVIVMPEIRDYEEDRVVYKEQKEIRVN